eukprot:7047909-Prymnesium_polylepis.1
MVDALPNDSSTCTVLTSCCSTVRRVSPSRRAPPVATETNWMTRLNDCVLPAPDSPEITTDWQRPISTPRYTRAAVRKMCGGA